MVPITSNARSLETRSRILICHHLIMLPTLRQSQSQLRAFELREHPWKYNPHLLARYNLGSLSQTSFQTVDTMYPVFDVVLLRASATSLLLVFDYNGSIMEKILIVFEEALTMRGSRHIDLGGANLTFFSICGRTKPGPNPIICVRGGAQKQKAIETLPDPTTYVQDDLKNPWAIKKRKPPNWERVHWEAGE